MGIDAKTIQGFVSGLVRCSVNSCCRRLKKHPFVSGVALVFFLLYLFIPSVFNFVIYSSPVIICIFASVKIYSRTQQSKIQYAKAVDVNNSSVESKSLPLDDHHVVSRTDGKPEIHSHVSRRRNFKGKNKESDAEGSKEEKAGMVSTSTAADALNIIGNLAAVLDEKGNTSSHRGESSGQNASVDRGIQTHDGKEKESYCNDRGESSSKNASNAEDVQALDQQPSVLYSQPSMSDLITSDGQPEKFIIGGGAEVVVVESSDDAEDEDEEGAQRDRNKAVEWNADDQQNLMDLGDSEVERNKRLESLIARRRARKLFKMAMEKRGSDSDSTPPGQIIGPLSIVRNNLLNSPNGHDIIEGMQMPGSAPSVLLPARNPFDIPYDSSEEKPNLMADSFHHEFSAAQFCRHESFFFRPSFSMDSEQDHHDSRFGPYGADKRIENTRFAKFRTQSEVSTHDQLIDDFLSQEGQAVFRMFSTNDLDEAGSEAPKQVKKPVEYDAGEDREPGIVVPGTTGEKKTSQDTESRSSVDRSEIQMETDSVRDNSSEPSSSDGSELSFQGNVSTSIEAINPKVGKFPQKLSDRVQKSLTFLVPESVGFHGPPYDCSPSGADRPRMEERLFYRDKLPCHSPVYSIASDLQVEVSEVGSPPLPIDGSISPADIESSYDADVEKEITSGSEEMWGAASHLLGVEENESRSKEVNDLSDHDVIGARFSAMKQTLQDPVTPSRLPAHVTEHDMRKASALASLGTEIPENDKAHSKNAENKVSENVKQVTDEVKKSNFSDALPPKIPHKGVHSEMPEELANTSQKSATEARNVDAQVVNANDAKPSVMHVTSTDLPQPAEKITSETRKSVKNTSDTPPEHPYVDHGKLSKSEATGKTSKSTAGQDDENSVQDSRNEQTITEVGVSGINQSSDIPTLAALQPILVAEQFSSGSSSCSSPRSVLPGKVPKDQIPSSQFERQIHINVPQSVVVATAAKNNLMNDEPPGLILAAPPNSLHLVVNPPNGPSTSSNSGKSEVPSAGVVEAKSESSMRPVEATVQSERAHQPHPGSVGDVKGKSKAPPDCSPSKPEEKIANSNVPATMVKEEETRNSSGQSTGEDNIIKKANDPVVNEKEYNENLKSVIGCEDASQQQKGKLKENEATVGSSNSVDGNKSSSVINGSENIKHIPKTDISEGKLEATTEAGRDESETSEASTKPSTPPAETAAQADPLPQKSSEKVDINHNVNEIVANETTNKKSSVDKENIRDQTKPGMAAAEVDTLHNVNEKLADETSNAKKLVKDL